MLLLEIVICVYCFVLSTDMLIKVEKVICELGYDLML